MEESVVCDDSSGAHKQANDTGITDGNQTEEHNNNNNTDNNAANDANIDFTINTSDDSLNGRPNNRSAAHSAPKFQRTFVQALYEMFPQRHGVRYVEEGRTGPPHNPLFQVSVHVNGQIFFGTARTKQSARHEAAKEAINYFTRYLRQSSTEIAAHNRRSYTNDGYHRYAPYYSPYRSQTYDYNHFSYTDIKRQFVSKEAEDEWRSDDFNSDWGRRDSRYDYNRDHWQRGGDYYSRRRVFDYPLPSSEPSLNAPQQSSECANTSDTVQQTSATTDVEAGAQSGKNDFTSDNYDHENFVEFKKNDGDKTDEENDDQEMANADKGDVDPKFGGKKERIILRVMSETPVHQNPVSVIHELHPDSQWHFLGAEEDSRKTSIFQMRLQLPLANQSYMGSGRTKKLAKAAAASKALLQLYNISINPQNLNNPESYVPKSTVLIAQEPLFLNQDLSNKIGTVVMNKCTEVWNALTEIKKWTVLASIVITDETNVDFIEVICLTSGTKCVKGDSLSMNGLALNDCHAEVLARRCFLNYLYSQIELIIENNYQDKPEFILERREDSYGFRIKKHFKVHLFISTAPCGDSRVFSPKEENESDAHPNRVTRGVLRAKIEGGEGTIPVKRDAILTWDGILQGHQRLQFMSCSDKIAVWNVVGLQGSLLSHILEPLYLESVILGSLFNYEHLVRALHGRLNLNFDSNSLKGLPETYRFNKAKVAKCQLKEDLTRQLTKTPPYAINWMKGDQTPEVISCDTGRVHKEGSVSRLSKRSLFARFCSLLGQNAPTLPTCALGNNIPVIYRDGKTASQDYQRAKTQVMNTFQEQNLGNWIQVPTEIDLFRL